MAFLENVITRTYTAGADLSADQFHFVTMNTSGKVVVTGAGAAADGVLINNPILDDAATVVYDGRVPVVAGGTITQGENLASNATGEAVAAATSDVIVAKAYEAGVAGQVITVEISRAGTIA